MLHAISGIGGPPSSRPLIFEQHIVCAFFYLENFNVGSLNCIFLALKHEPNFISGALLCKEFRSQGVSSQIRARKTLNMN